MSYPKLFILLGTVLVVLGGTEDVWFRPAIWLGSNFIILGIAHWRGTHQVFGKRADGTLPGWSWLLFFPLLGYTLLVWHVIRWCSREPARNVVNAQLVVGRRVLASEWEGEFDNFIDLTAEFSEPGGLRHLPSYRCFPVLDGSAPTPAALLEAVASLKPGRTFIHCAQGHGRTGLFAMAVLLHSGAVRNIPDGLQMLRAVRPGIGLSQAQRDCLEIYAQRVMAIREH